MKISYQWLAQYINLKESLPQDIGEKITAHTAELEEIIEQDGDYIYDIDNKSLTHRPDLMGHRGFARELSVIFDQPLMLPEPAVSLPEMEGLSVFIETPLCRRFCSLGMSHVKIKPAPTEVTQNIEKLDIKSISNLVDITNFILLDFGQPMHVFDADKINGNITVRMAKNGEKLIALNEKEYELTDQDIVIADDHKILSIAGIMGGLESSVTESTTNILFEAANFDPTAIRKTASRLGIRTDSSSRFEKSLPPELPRKAILTAAEKALEWAPGSKLNSALSDIYPDPVNPPQIKFSPDRMRERSGVSISDQEIEKTLNGLGFEIQKSKKEWITSTPNFRSIKDIAIPEDIEEEVIRMHGFDNIPSTKLSLSIGAPKPNNKRELEWDARYYWAARGFNEVYHYSFVGEEDKALTQLDQYVEIANPLSSDNKFLRRTLLTNLIKNIEPELKSHPQVKFFEVGSIFRAQEAPTPEQKDNLGWLIGGINQDSTDLFFQLKNEIFTWLNQKGITPEIKAIDELSKTMHPSKSGMIEGNGIPLGSIYILHPRLAPTKKAHIVFAELDTDKILEALEKTSVEVQKVSPFPFVHRDLSFIVSQKTFSKQLLLDAQKACPELKKGELFDEFEDAEKIGAGLKNLSFHLSFQSDTKTFDEKEVDNFITNISEHLQKEHQITLRT